MIFGKNKLAILIVAAMSASMLSSASAEVIYGDAADTTVSFASPTPPVDGGGTVGSTTASLTSGRNSGGTYFNTVFVVQLPSLGAVANPFTSAQFTFTIANTNAVDAFDSGLRHDLYGLGRRSSSAVQASDFYIGGADSTDATLVGGSIVTGGNAARFTSNVTKTTTGSAFVNYINAQYAGGAGAGDYVFLRLNVNKTNGSAFDISLYPATTANNAQKPQITYTAVEAVPEPTGMAVVGLVGGALALTRRRSIGE